MRKDHLERSLAVAAALAALLVLAGLPAATAAERGDTARARATVYAGGVDFVPEVAYQKAILTVSGNGQTYRREVEAGSALSIDLFDPEGQLLADGTYTWQLQLVPTKAAARRLREAAAAGRPFEPWRAQSGAFTIRGGAIADPDLVEEQTLRRAAADAESAAGARSAFAPDRGPGEDGDAAVGSRAGVEARVSAAASAAAPGGGTLHPGGAPSDDSDAVTTALGRSLEPPAAPDNQNTAQPLGSTPRPRSDGSNGRPRS